MNRHIMPVVVSITGYVVYHPLCNRGKEPQTPAYIGAEQTEDSQRRQQLHQPKGEVASFRG